MAEPLFSSILLPGEQSLQSVQIAGKGEADLQAGQRPQMPGDSRGEVRTDRLLDLLQHRGLSRLVEVEESRLHRLVECSTNRSPQEPIPECAGLRPLDDYGDGRGAQMGIVPRITHGRCAGRSVL